MDGQGLAAVKDGLIKAALADERGPEVGVDVGGVGLEDEGLLEVGDGFIHLPTFEEQVTEVVVSDAGSRVSGEGRRPERLQARVSPGFMPGQYAKRQHQRSAHRRVESTSP